MKTKLLLLILWSLSTSIYAQSSLTFEPEDAMPTTFDSWSTSFLIVKTDVKAGDKFIFFTEPVEVPDWEWGPQIQPKNNSDWSSLTTPLSPDAEGKIVFVLNEVTANIINDNGGLRVQGMGIRVLDVQFEAGSDALLDVEGTIVWAGDAIVNGWTNQPYLLSDGGMELKTTNAEVGDILRFYMSAPDIYWQIELFEGHWAKQYVRWSEVPLYNEDGSERESVIIDLTNDGYAELEITQEILDNAYKSNGWGGVFLLNGDGNVTVTAITLIKKSETNPDDDDSFEKATEAVKNMKIGWNLWNTLDAHSGGDDWGITDPKGWETCWGNAVTKPELMKMMRKAGFNAVRVPVTWFPHMDAEGNVDRAWMDRVHEVVDYVIDQGLYCIVNVHHDTGEGAWILADEDNYQQNHERFEYLWRQIAEEFKDYDQHLLFEGYNEMLDVWNSWGRAAWGHDDKMQSVYNALNNYAQSFVNTVRATGGNNKWRNLVVNTYSACGEDPVWQLKIPADVTSGHIAFQVHYYQDVENLSIAKANVDMMMKVWTDAIKSKKAPLIIGEWGCWDGDKYTENLLSYASYLIAAAKANDIATFDWLGPVSGGQYRTYPAFENPEYVKTILKSYYGNGFDPTLLTIDDYEFRGVDVSYSYLWAELNIIDKPFSLDDYKGIRIELENADGLLVKVYGETDGKEQYCGMASSSETFLFNRSDLGESVQRITLQNSKEGTNQTKIYNVYLIKNDGTEEMITNDNYSVYHGCEYVIDMPRKQDILTVTYDGLWSELNIYYDDIPLKLKNYKGIRLELAAKPTDDSFHIKVYGDGEEKEDYLPLTGTSTTILFNTNIFTKEINRVTLQYILDGKDEAIVAGAWLIRQDGTEEFSDISPYWGCEMSNTSTLLGDANGDFVVDISDVLVIVDQILNRPVKKFLFHNANVTKDNTIDISDVLSVVDIILGR